MNFYINRAQLWLSEAEQNNKPVKMVLDRIASTVASLILGRYLGESIEDYYKRNPSHKEYIDWWHSKRKKYGY